MTYWVYVVSNRKRTALYIGVTNNLERRAYEHRFGLIKGFTSRYHCTDLVYFEETSSIETTIARGKELKKWSRAKKDILIASCNYGLKDLSRWSR